MLRPGLFSRVHLRLHPSWAIAFILFVAMVVTQFTEAYLLWQRIALGISAVLLFFAALGIREFTLNFLALHRGIPEKKVTLFVFGGASQLAEDETTPLLEVLLAMAGLLTNLVITGILYALHSILVALGSTMVSGLILWVAFVYFMLSLLHFLPAFPLDCGRLLRAVLWRLFDDYNRATNIASWMGQGVGFLFIAGGILVVGLTTQWINGLVLVLIGWLLQVAAAQARRPVVLRRVLRGVRARDVVARDCPLIRQRLSLGRLIRDYIMATGHRYFVVAEGGRLKGVVGVRQIRKVPKKRRRSTTVGEIMTPASQFRAAWAEQPAASLLEQMLEWQIDCMPVLEEGRVIGIVERDALARLAKTRAELRR